MSKRIQILQANVREKIAAGEVIERPASVVKELLENSLDAGATELAVILEDGGKALIEVIDNGNGMGAEDLELCSKRHATSKIQSLEDLEKLSTLGFRGEALPSVAAVSELSILSRARDSSTAHEVLASGELEREDGASANRAQRVTFGHFLGSPHGTRIQARSLFSQMPARLKFLKSQAAEVAQVREWIERLALSHPEAGFRLVSNDRTVLTLRPQDEVSRIRTILGDGEDFPVITATSEAGNPIQVRAHWLQGLSTPQMRRLVQVVNGRAVRDRLLQQALLSPFRQALLPGQFPAFALFVDVDPASVDVNVHPTKTEVRFLDSRQVFHTVQKLVESMIAKNGAPGFVSAPASERQMTPPLLSPQTPWNFAPRSTAMQNSPLWQASESDATSSVAPVSAASAIESSPISHAAPSHPFHQGRFAGIIFNTYIMYDLGEELGLIDQHAAHERVRYEKLRTRALSESAAPLNPQALLIPEAIKFNEESRPTLEACLPRLLDIGFEAELFSNDTVLFRSVPSEWGTESLRTRLKNLVDRVLAAELSGADSKLRLDETLFEALASEACHSAIRAGDRLEPIEATTLLSELFKCEHPWNCPHGRPTVVRIPRARFEEWFQRRV